MNKVLLLSHEFSPFLGGAGSVARELFIGLQRSKINVSLCTHRNAAVEGIDHILKSAIVTKQHSAINYLKYYIYLILKLNRYKLIIVNDFFFTLYSIFFFTKKQYSKTYYYVHGCEFEALLSHKVNTILNGNLCHLYIKMLTLSKGVIFVSDFVKNEFFKKITEESSISYDDFNIIKYKSIVIHNGIDESLFYRVNSSSPAKKRIITTSRITKMKGYDTMLDAMSNFLSLNKDYYWEIIGSGDYFSTLKSKINKLNSNISSRIKLLGNVERKKLKYVYSDASVFLLLSDYDEAHPLVYMEAALCGLPSIAWNKGGCPEAIINGKTGILINKIDDLQYAINESVKIDKKTIIDSSISFYSQKMIDSWVSLLK